MLKKLLRLGVFIMATQLITPAYSVNHKLLDLEADSCVSNIWAALRVSKTKIQESLGFLSDSDSQDPKYTQKGNFKKLYEKITDQVKDQKLSQFAQDCRLFRKESSDRATKIAVQLLLEKVTEKYTKELAKAEKIKLLNEQNKSRDDTQNGNLFKVFLNADRSIIIH